MEYKPNTPIYLQVINDIIQKILKNEICPNDKLPSTRDLADAYKINPNTAARVYSELERMGMCHIKRGLGTYVNDDKELIQQLRDTFSKNLLTEFTQGMISIGYTPSTILTTVTEYLKNIQ